MTRRSRKSKWRRPVECETVDLVGGLFGRASTFEPKAPAPPPTGGSRESSRMLLNRRFITAEKIRTIVSFVLPALVVAGAAADSVTSTPPLDLSTIESRRAAMMALEREVSAQPESAGAWLRLSEACLGAQRPTRGRECLEHAALLAPGDPAIQLNLGLAWKRYWVASMDSTCFIRADSCLTAAVESAPEQPDAFVELASLELLAGRPRRAAELAGRAYAIDPRRGDALLAFGCAAYRMGSLSRAAGAFDLARPLLPPALAKRFNDESWFVSDALVRPDELGHVDPSIVQEYWDGNDPDLTTAENEAHLDFLSRLALALLLFREGQEVRWDERAELFVRYGPPTAVLLGDDLLTGKGLEYSRHPMVEYAPSPLMFPHDQQTWIYAELGLRVDLWDMALSGTFWPATARDGPAPGLNTAVLADRADVAAFQNGRAVFRTMPPGTSPMSIRTQVSKFPSESGARLMIAVEAPASDGDGLVAACSISDEQGTSLARESVALSLSACDPSTMRAGAFVIDAPRGAFRIDVSVSGPLGGRGLSRRRAVVEADGPGLAVSDLVMVCARDAADARGGAIRLEPDLDRHVTGARALSVYFEAHRLRPDSRGESRFRYDCSVHRVGAGSRAGREDLRRLNTTREEAFTGSIRRQFVDVPVATLPVGTYELRIEAHDLVARSHASRTLTFVRE